MSVGERPLPDETLERSLGLEAFGTDEDGVARGRMAVSDRVKQPFGIVHGGAYASLAESVTSRATYEEVGPGSGAFGQSNHTTFLRPVSAGTIDAVAHARHRGRTSWVWDVEMTDEQGRLCAISRLIIAVRPLEGVDGSGSRP